MLSNQNIMVKTILSLILSLAQLPMPSVAASDADSLSLGEGGGLAADSLVTDKISSKLSIQLSATASRMIHHGPDINEVLHSYSARFFDIRLKRQQSFETPTAFDQAMNYPSLQVGLQLDDFSNLDIYRPETPYRSRIGRMATLYGGIQIPLLRAGRFTLGTDLQNGLAYCPHPFDENDNVDNEIIGSTLSIYVNLGFYLRYRLSSHWSASAGVDFKHFSNGTLDRPNIGINALGGTLSVDYNISPQAESAPRRVAFEKEGRRGFYVEAMAGLGMKALFDGFSVNHSKHNAIYGFPTVMIAPMYRYHLLHASGIGIDYTYSDYVYTVRLYDQILGHPAPRYSPHVAGITLRHEIFYRHFSLSCGVGTYLCRHLGRLSDDESRIYQTVSLRYSFPFTSDRLFLGYNVKAHRFQKVECLQVVAGYRIW